MWMNGRLVFVHNPKAAGTSIQYALGGMDRSLHPHAPLRRVKAPQGAVSFGVARDPVDRLVSLYKWIVSRAPAGLFMVGQTPMLGEQVRHAGFSRWLRDDRYRLWMDGDDPEEDLPLQRRPQYWWLGDVDLILRFGHLENDWQEFRRMTGMFTDDLPVLNRSQTLTVAEVTEEDKRTIEEWHGGEAEWVRSMDPPGVQVRKGWRREVLVGMS